MVVVQCRACYRNGKVVESGEKGERGVLRDATLVEDRCKRKEGLRRNWHGRESVGKGRRNVGSPLIHVIRCFDGAEGVNVFQHFRISRE